MNNTIQKTDSGLKIIPKHEQISGIGVFTSVEIKQTKEHYDDSWGMLRMYSDYIGDGKENLNGFVIQIRALQPLTDKGVPRNIIASIQVSEAEILAMAAFTRKVRKEYDMPFLNE